MTRRLDPLLEDLRQTALRMGSLAETILAKSLRAVWERNAQLAAEVKTDDIEIDRIDVAIDEGVLRTLSLQTPVANDLRMVLAIRTMATDLERVGDLARNIAKSALRLCERPPVPLPQGLEELADQALRVLADALDSFTETDAAKARAVLAVDDEIDKAEDRVVEIVIAEAGAHPELTAQEVDFLMIAKHLERVADHATNIAEEVIFLSEARIVRHAAKLGGSVGGR
jgi:phosphate transport system protein